MMPDLRLLRKSGRPLYLQLQEHYRELIEENVLLPGTRLPTETELCERYGISRGTVRQAMSSLVEAGLIERSAKSGTFVRGSARPQEPIAGALNAPAPRSPSEGVIIGVILPNADDAFCMDIMKGAQAACRSRGYHVAFAYSHESEAQQRFEIERMRKANFSGLAIFPLLDPTTIEALHQDAYPFVLIDQHFEHLPTDFVGVDNVNGAYRATEHLILLGHRHIAFVQHGSFRGDQAPSTIRSRWKGYCQALKDYNLSFEPSWLYTAEVSSSSDAATGFMSFFTQPEPPSAAFAVNDNTALSLMRAAKLKGVSIPRDLALVGFDDLPVASQLSISLTTIAQPRYDIGLKAAHALIDGIEQATFGPQRIILPTELKIRESCGARHHTVRQEQALTH